MSITFCQSWGVVSVNGITSSQPALLTRMSRPSNRFNDAATAAKVGAVRAMLAAIGIMIIVKQIPPLLGDLAPLSKDMLTAIITLPESLTRIEWPVMLIGTVCLFLMFYLNTTRIGALKRLPPALFVAIVGILLGYLFDLDARYLISMPDDILEGGITLPAFEAVWQRSELWGSVLIVVITLTLIDTAGDPIFLYPFAIMMTRIVSRETSTTRAIMINKGITR